MASRPSISVVIPAFNAARWIAETIDSVLGQTLAPAEIIVVDDGSTDDLDRVLEPYLDKLTLVRQPNAGCGAAFNTGFSTAAGDYVALCPADDIWEPHKLEWQSSLLAEQPVVDVSFTAAVNFGLVDGPFARPSGDGVLDNEQFRREMFVVNRIPDPSVVLRRDLHAELGGYVPEIGEDYEFWFRALERGAVFHFEPRVTVRLRQHRTNLSANAVAIWRMMVRVHEAHASTFADTDFVNAILARDHRRLARAELGMGNAEAAAAAYRKAAEYGGRRSDRIRASMTGLPVLRPVGRWLSASRGVGA